jgi:hypothetical protein
MPVQKPALLRRTDGHFHADISPCLTLADSRVTQLRPLRNRGPLPAGSGNRSTP